MADVPDAFSLQNLLTSIGVLAGAAAGAFWQYRKSYKAPAEPAGEFILSSGSFADMKYAKEAVELLKEMVGSHKAHVEELRGVKLAAQEIAKMMSAEAIEDRFQAEVKRAVAAERLAEQLEQERRKNRGKAMPT